MWGALIKTWAGKNFLKTIPRDQPGHRVPLAPLDTRATTMELPTEGSGEDIRFKP